jgi:hypothetical protein
MTVNFDSHAIFFLCSATFRDLPRLFATLVHDFGRDYAKVKSRIGLPFCHFAILPFCHNDFVKFCHVAILPICHVILPSHII